MSWWDRTNRWADAHRFVVDAAGTALLLLVVVPLTAALSWQADGMGGVTFWTVLLVAPLAWRRVSPAASAAAVYLVALAHTLAGYPALFPADLAVLVALYSVTVHGPRWANRVAIAGALVGSFVLAVGMYAVAGYRDVVQVAVIATFGSTGALAVWAFGLLRRSRRDVISALVDRAERLQVERDQEARIATAAERSRIAREIHDIIAHSLSVIIAQADGGRYAADADPAAATRALGTISETGRAALADMRRLLGVLRPGEGGDEPGADRRVGGGPGGLVTPQPGAEDVEGLVEQVRASGMRVSLVRMGQPRTLPPGTGLTVYRICQEALTNVLKHAGPNPGVTVLLQWTPDALVLEVGDDGRGAAADSDGVGQGLVGMRERAAMFGGTVTAGPRPGGGFRVRARLPLPTSAAPSPGPTAPSAPAPGPAAPSTPPAADDRPAARPGGPL